ncbi:MAG: hypothetical protein WBS24_12170 [Terriglobales bacterium]
MRRFVRMALPVLAGAMVFVIGSSSSLWASVPEIDPTSSISGIALLAGAVVVIRGWRK